MSMFDGADVMRVAVVLELYNSMRSGMLSALTDVNNLESRFQQLSKNANFSFSTAQKSLYNLSKGVAAVGAGVTLAGVAMAGALDPFLKNSAKMESAMAKVNIATQGSIKSVKDYKAALNDVQSLSVKVAGLTQFSAPDVMGFAAQLGSMGFHNPRGLTTGGTKSSALMAATQFAEVERTQRGVAPQTSITAAGRIAGLLGLMNNPAQFTKALQMTFQASMLTPSSLQQMTTTLGQMGGVPWQMFGKTREASGSQRLMLAAFLGRISTGRQGNEMATALENLIPNVYGSRGQTRLRAFAAGGFLTVDQKKKTGHLDFFDNKGEFIGILPLLKLLNDRTQKMSTMDKMAVFQGAFGSVGPKVLMPLMDPRNQASFKQMLEDQKHMMTLQQAQAALYNTFNGQLTNLQTNWESLTGLLGGPLRDFLKDIMLRVNSILSAVIDWTENHKDMAALLVKIAAVFGGIMLVVGPLMIALGTMGMAVVGIAGLTTAFGGLGVIAATVLPPIAALAGVIAVIVAGWKAWSSASAFSVGTGSGGSGGTPHGGSSNTVAEALKGKPLALTARGSEGMLNAVRTGRALINQHHNMRVNERIATEQGRVNGELDKGILGMIHGPMPIHQQPPVREVGSVPTVETYKKYLARLRKATDPVALAAAEEKARKNGKALDVVLGKPHAREYKLYQTQIGRAKATQARKDAIFQRDLEAQRANEAMVKRAQKEIGGANAQRQVHNDGIEALRKIAHDKVSMPPTQGVAEQKEAYEKAIAELQRDYGAAFLKKYKPLLDSLPFATGRDNLKHVNPALAAGSKADVLKRVARGFSPVNTPLEMKANTVKLWDDLSKIFPRIATALKDIGTATSWIDRLKGAVSLVIAPVQAIFDAFTNVGKTANGISKVKGVMELLVLPTRAVMGVGHLLWDVFKIPIDPLQLVFSAVQGLAQAVYHHMPEIKKTITDTWTEVMRQTRAARTEFMNVVGPVLKAFQASFGKGGNLRVIINGFFDFFQLITDTFEKFFVGVWPGVATIFKGFWEQMEGFISLFWHGFVNTAQIFIDIFTLHWDRLGGDMKKGMTDTWNALKLIFKGAVDSLIKGPIEALAGGVGAAFDHVIQSIKNKFADMIDMLAKVPLVGDKFKGMSDQLRAGVGGDFAKGTVPSKASTHSQAALQRYGMAVPLNQAPVTAIGSYAWLGAGISSNRFIGKGDPLLGTGTYNFPFGKGGYNQHAKTMYDTDIPLKYGTPIAAPVDLIFMGRMRDKIAGLYDQFQVASGPHKGANMMALHMSQYATFKDGQMVKAGTWIGNSGSPPGVNAPHLCWVTDESGHEELMLLMGKPKLVKGGVGGGAIGVPMSEMPSFAGANFTIAPGAIVVNGATDPTATAERVVDQLHKHATASFAYGAHHGITLRSPRPGHA